MIGHRDGKINVKVVVIILLVTAVLGAGALTARYVRRNVLSARALEQGQAAFSKQDWPEARNQFLEYLGRNPDNIDILGKFAEASLRIRPLEGKDLKAAVNVYRQIIGARPSDKLPYDRLAMVYEGVGQFEELVYIARKRLAVAPDDLQAPLWLAKSLLKLRKPQDQEALDVLAKLVKGLDARREKHPEYVKACALMSQITGAGNSEQSRAEALKWLDRGVAYDDKSVEALVQRSRFYRQISSLAGKTSADLSEAAQKDLTRADEIGTDNPEILLILSEEWTAHGKLDKASAEMKLAEKVDQAAVAKSFFDPNDWVLLRFLQTAELAMQRDAVPQDASLADKALEILKEPRLRVSALRQAIRLYVACGRTSDARRCLDEFLELTPSATSTAGLATNVSYLRALVARAEDLPYQVIEVLDPVIVANPSEPEPLKLMAEACSRTDQNRRSVHAILSYLRLRPQDPKMTLQLAKEYLKLRDWNRAFETARLAEPLDPADIVIKLLRIEASVYLAAEQTYQIDTVRLDALGKELVALRRDHPDRVDIRVLQAIIAIYQKRTEVAEQELKLAIKECKDTLPAEMQLARHFYRMKRPQEATEVCRQACQRHAELSEPWLSLSGIYAAQEDSGKARQAIRDGLSHMTERWENRALRIRLAMLELLEGDRKVGEDLLFKLAREDKQEIRARALLLSLRDVRESPAAAELVGAIHQAQGETGLLWRLYQASLWLSGEDWRSKQQDIAAYAQKCIDSDPEWSEPALLLVEMYQRLGNPERAEDVCRQALTRNPSATDVADRLVTLLEKQGRFADAQQVLKAVEANPRVMSSWYVRLALQSGDLTGAIDELRLRVSNDDRDANSRILLARLLYWQTRDAKQASKYLQEAESISAGSMALTAAKVMILKAEGNLEQAEKLLEENVAKNKDFSSYLMRATYLADAKKYEPAERDFLKLTTFPDSGARGYEALAAFYVTTDKVDKAAASLQKGTQAFPKDLSLKRDLMRILFARNAPGDEAQAVEMLSSLEKQLPNDPEFLRTRAIQLAKAPSGPSLPEARTILERAVLLAPASVLGHLSLIAVAMEQEDYKAARDFSIRGLASNPESVPLVLARARAESALGSGQMAAELAHVALAKSPENSEARDLLIAFALKGGDAELLKEAGSLIEKAMSKSPADEQLQLANASLLAAMNQTQKGQADLKAYSVTAQGSRSAQTFLALAEFCRAGGDVEGCKSNMQQAEKLAPKDSGIVQARLLLLATQKRFDEIPNVVASYRAAGFDDPRILLSAASILVTSESPDHRKASVKLYEDVLAAKPRMMEARLGLAAAAYRTGDAQRAKKVYGDVLKDDSGNASAMNDLAWILAENDHDYKAALELADKCLKIDPANAHLLDTRGFILSNLSGRLDEARKTFEKLVDATSPGGQARAQALLQLARVCSRLKDQAATKKCLEEARQIDDVKQVFDPRERAEIAKLTGNS